MSAALVASADAPVPRLWDAVVVANEVEVPFRFELSSTDGKVEGATGAAHARLKAELTKTVEKLLAEKASLQRG